MVQSPLHVLFTLTIHRPARACAAAVRHGSSAFVQLSDDEAPRAGNRGQRAEAAIPEPPSFSTVDWTLPADELREQFPKYAEAAMEEIEVRAGEMLYLPAGWFHLVESRGADLRNPRHMALNYWVHPPDAGSGRFDAPYTSEFWPRDWAARDVSALRIDRGSSSRKRKKGRVTPVHVEALDAI